MVVEAPKGLGFKIGLHLIAPLSVLFVLNSLDRVNVGFAALQMNAALQFTPQIYGFGISIFFVGYVLLQYPHVLLQRVLGARLWILAASLAWGTVATAMTFINDPLQFYVLRFLLGVAEGGFAPGVVYYLTNFAPRRYRGGAIAGTMLAIPISVVIGGPLSGWLMTIDNPLSLPGWRFLFLAEGVLTLVASVLLFGLFKNNSEEVTWLTAEEKAFIRDELARERNDAPEKRVARFSSVVLSARVWIAALAWFALLTGAYAMMFWLPLALRQMSTLSDLDIGIFSALPWAALGTGMLLNAWHSDRTGERHWHLFIPAVLSAVSYALSASTGGELAFGLLVVGGFFMGCAQGVFWTLPGTFLAGAATSLGVTIINMLGNSAGVITPPIIAWIREESGSFAMPVYVLAGLMALGALMVPLIALLTRGATAGETGAHDRLSRAAK